MIEQRRDWIDDFHRQLQQTYDDEELESLRVQLVGDLISLDGQLADRDRRTAEGERMSSHEYWAWRKKALLAQTSKKRQLLIVNSEIKLRRKQSELRRLKKEVKTFKNALTEIADCQGQDLDGVINLADQALTNVEHPPERENN